MTYRPKRALSLSRRSLLAGTAVALAAPAARIGAQTPAAVEEVDFAARIGALLAAMPADAVSGRWTFFYADLAGQLAAAGVDRPPADRTTRDLPVAFHQAAAALPLASRAFLSGLDPRWYPAFGFNPAGVGQTLMVGDGGATIALFRGGFDPDDVRTALVASGYAEVRYELGDAFTFGNDVELDSTVGQLTLGTMNHAVVRDDLLVFAGDESRIEAVLAVLAGDAPSMASRGRWTELVTLFSVDTVGMIPVPASSLAFWSGATPTAAAATLLDIAFGVRAGSVSEPVALGGEGTPLATPVGVPAVPARIEARLRYADTTTAAREAEAIPRRWRDGESALTEEPFTELMKLVDAGVSTVDPRAVAVDFTADTPNRWSQLIFTNDLSPFIPAME